MPVLSHGFVFPGGTFFNGAATADSSVVPAKYPVAIAGRPYNIEPRLYERGFIESQRPAQDQTPEPGEASLSPEGPWRRSQSDWSLGTGQVWLDEEESTRRRVATSLGVDLFDDRQMTLLPSTEEKRNSSNTNLKVRRVGSRLYAMDGTNILFSDATNSEQNATWVTNWTTATGLPGGNQLDFTFSGSHVYVLGSDNSIYRATVGTTAFTLWFNPVAVITRIYAGLGRLFASETNKLYEITATPGETLIFTHPDPNYVFTSLCAAPTGIYFTGTIGTELGELRHTWVRDDGTAFVPPVVAAEYLNEGINVCAARGNVMLIGTTAGWRFAQIDNATTGLNFGPVVAVGDVRDIVYDTVGASTFAWFTWTNITSGNSGLGRIRIARQTETLVPAYSSDIYTASGATIISVASIRDRRYFAASSDGFFGATGNKVASGTFTTGRIRYSLLSAKIFATLQWRTAPLFGSISVTMTLDDGNVLPVASQTDASSLGIEPTRLSASATGEWAELTFTLTRDGGDTTKGPTLRWWVLRAIQAVDGTKRFIVPLRLERLTQVPNGPAVGVDVASEIDFIDSLITHRAVVKYQEGFNAYDVYVMNMRQRPEQWAEMDAVLEGILLVELHSVN